MILPYGFVRQERTTRDALLRASLRVVADGGLAAATSRRITDEAGANLAAITYHFGSKESLLSEALLSEARRWLEPVLVILRDEDSDPVARTSAAVVSLQSALAQARPLLPAYFEALNPASPLRAVRKGILRMLAEVRAFLSAEMARQVKAGDLPAWLDPAAMASLQLAVVHGVAFQTLLGAKPTEATAMAGQFLQLLIAARSD